MHLISLADDIWGPPEYTNPPAYRHLPSYPAAASEQYDPFDTTSIASMPQPHSLLNSPQKDRSQYSLQYDYTLASKASSSISSNSPIKQSYSTLPNKTEKNNTYSSLANSFALLNFESTTNKNSNKTSLDENISSFDPLFEAEVPTKENGTKNNIDKAKSSQNVVNDTSTVFKQMWQENNINGSSTTENRYEYRTYNNLSSCLDGSSSVRPADYDIDSYTGGQNQTYANGHIFASAQQSIGQNKKENAVHSNGHDANYSLYSPNVYSPVVYEQCGSTRQYSEVCESIYGSVQGNVYCTVPEDILRPHRPAPPSPLVLGQPQSMQQIQRKIQQGTVSQNTKVYNFFI